jgi:Beta-lactamase enzyme family
MRLARTAALVVILSLAGYVVASRGSTPRGRTRDESDHRVTTSTGKIIVTPAAKNVASRDENVFSVPAVASYLAGQTNGITAAVYDNVTGNTSLYRPGVAEDTASIMKVDILATLLSQAQAQGQALTPDQQELSEDMIEESDDDDAQDLWDAEGGASAVGSFNARAGLTQTVPDAAGYWGLSTTTAVDQVQLLKKVAYPNSLLTDASRNYELDLMTHVDPNQTWGVSSGVVPGATVAIKNGWLPLDAGGWQINSIGWIDGDGRDYLVAVLSNGNATEGQGIDSIESLSDLIWNALAPSKT